ncbi:MAG: hypothetical protein ACO1NO_02175 [Burkholderiaceae bacterium]
MPIAMNQADTAAEERSEMHRPCSLQDRSFACGKEVRGAALEKSCAGRKKHVSEHAEEQQEKQGENDGDENGTQAAETIGEK